MAKVAKRGEKDKHFLLPVRFLCLCLHLDCKTNAPRIPVLYTVLLALAVVTACVLLLGIRIFFVGGRFPHFHISGNKEMQKRGIDCVESQDRRARRRSPFAVDEIVKSVGK